MVTKDKGDFLGVSVYVNRIEAVLMASRLNTNAFKNHFANNMEILFLFIK